MDNKIDEIIQQELFALPTNNKLVATVDGTKLYSNDKLKKKYIEALEDSRQTKKYSKGFERLIDEGKIVPCWLSKGLLGFIAYKIFAPFSVKGILAFFHPESKKFYIIIDNNVSIGVASNTMLGKLTLHESMHMVAHKNPNSFLKLFDDELSSWYYHFLKNVFKLEEKNIPKNLDFGKPIKYVFRNVEINMSISNSVFKNYSKMVSNLCKPYTTLEEDEFEQTLTDLITLPRVYYMNFDSFMQIVKKYENIVKPMYDAYNDAFGIKSTSTFCIQELLYPSEIISIYAESKGSSKISRALKVL